MVARGPTARTCGRWWNRGAAGQRDRSRGPTGEMARGSGHEVDTDPDPCACRRSRLTSAGIHRTSSRADPDDRPDGPTASRRTQPSRRRTRARSVLCLVASMPRWGTPGASLAVSGRSSGPRRSDERSYARRPMGPNPRGRRVPSCPLRAHVQRHTAPATQGALERDEYAAERSRWASRHGDADGPRDVDHRVGRIPRSGSGLGADLRLLHDATGRADGLRRDHPLLVRGERAELLTRGDPRARPRRPRHRIASVPLSRHGV